MLEELLTWLGVGVVAAVAWALYAFGEDAPRPTVRSQEQRPEE